MPLRSGESAYDARALPTLVRLDFPHLRQRLRAVRKETTVRRAEAAINPNQFRNCWNGACHIAGRPSLHNETRSALVFVGFFFGFLALIAVAGLGGWWFMKHIAHEPFAHRHAAMTRATTL